MKIISTLILLLFFSTSFSQWKRVEQLPATDIISIYHQDTVLYAGSKNRVYFSRNNGLTWDSTSSIPGFTSVSGIIVYKKELYASSYSNGVFKSADGGVTWQNISSGIFPHVTDLTEWRGDLYASTLGASVFKLEPRNRNSWLNVSSGLSNQSANLNSIAGNTNVLLAGTTANALYDYLPANSTTWEEKFLLGRIRPTEGMYEIITAHDSLLLAGYTGRFYISTDNGLNWNTFGNILPSVNTSLANGKQAFLLSRTVFDGIDFTTGWYYIKKDSLQKSFVNFSIELSHLSYKLDIHGDKLWDASNKGLFFMSLSDLPGISSVDDSQTIALPVHFTLFNTKCNGDSVVITWKTAQEENSGHFDIEKSNDITHWTVIGNVPAAGKGGAVERSYSFTDNNPEQNTFYRIAEYDLEGKVQYTHILSLSCTTTTTFKLWPNPVHERLFTNIVANTESQAIIKVFDSKGGLVRSQRTALLQGENQLSIDMSSLTNGLYFLLVYCNNGQTKKTAQVLKQ